MVINVAQKSYSDKPTLYELYHKQRMTMEDIGDELGCTGRNISLWMDKLGVPKSRAEERAAFLEHLYHGKRMTQEGIGELLNCPPTSVGNFMQEHGIETRRQVDMRPPSMYFSDDGYLTCRHRVGDDRHAFRVHRLVAVAEHGFDEVSGNHVHHKNGMKVDNRPGNLELMTLSDHTAQHHEQGDILG